MSFVEASSVDDLIHRGFLVSRARHDVFVVSRDITAQDGRRLLGLEDASAVWSPPGIEQVVLPCAHEPLPTVGEL